MTDESESPRRGRPPRQQIVLGERRRRKDSSGLSNLKLGVEESGLDRENFQYYWANDRGGRIRQLHNDDWDVVDDASKVQATDDEGTKVARHAGLGDNNASIRAVLVRKPKQWYLEDQAEAQKPLDDLDKDLRRGLHHQKSPEAAAIAGEHGYVPEGSISIRDGRRK